MSRRHKETDINATQQHMTEPAADCRQQTTDNRSTIYIGDISEKGLDNLVSEVVDNCIDETLSGYSKSYKVTTLFSGLGGLNIGFEETKKSTLIDVLCSFLDTDTSQDNTPQGRGRPVVGPLCSMFSDAAIWPMVKEVYNRIYNKAITTAKNLGQVLVCFICALFRVVKTQTPYGRIEHFHRLLKGHLKKLPSVRTLQTGVQWLTDKTKTFFRCVNHRAEEAKHKAWEALEEMIFGHISNLAPQYAAI